MGVDKIVQRTWERQEGETINQYELFKIYLGLGKGRTLQDVERQRSGNPNRKGISGWLSTTSSKFKWPARATAYDNYQYSLELEAEENALREEREKWAKRKVQAAAKTWDRGERLHELAVELMQLPRVKRTVKKFVDAYDSDGKPIKIEQEIHLHPVKTTMRDIVLFFREADRLQRLATGENTENINVTTPQNKTEEKIADAKLNLQRAAAMFPGIDKAVLAQRAALQYDVDINLIYIEDE